MGAGVAVGLEEGGRVATWATVQVDGSALPIVRVVTAFECGRIIDPDNLRNQVEGATVMGLDWALFEELRPRTHPKSELRRVTASRASATYHRSKSNLSTDPISRRPTPARPR
jgi:CO/xanthine dehydrogenase Mo-binding subunit